MVARSLSRRLERGFDKTDNPVYPRMQSEPGAVGVTAPAPGLWTRPADPKTVDSGSRAPADTVMALSRRLECGSTIFRSVRKE